jgi:hypothetical protein
MASSNGKSSYEVHNSALIGQEIRRLQRQASRKGRGEEFLVALRAIVDRLHHDPNEFGEPLYRLPVLRMQLRCAVIRPLYVAFAVCED